PTYMSPELCRANGGRIDDRSDVYSLAVVLFEMLAGRPPFQGRAPGEMIAMHILEPAPRIDAFVDKVPRGLQELLARMLAKKPAGPPAPPTPKVAAPPAPASSAARPAAPAPTPVATTNPPVSSEPAVSVAEKPKDAPAPSPPPKKTAGERRRHKAPRLARGDG